LALSVNVAYRYKTTTSIASKAARQYVTNSQSIFSVFGEVQSVHQHYFSGVTRTGISHLPGGAVVKHEAGNFKFSIKGKKGCAVVDLSLVNSEKAGWKVWRAVLKMESESLPVTIMEDQTLRESGNLKVPFITSLRSLDLCLPLS
jgi:hypothetical protein